MDSLKRQKVLINQVVIFVLTAMTYAGVTTFGVDDVPGMAETVTLAVAALLELIGIVVTQRQVTPVSDPKGSNGVPLIPDPSFTVERS